MTKKIKQEMVVQYFKDSAKKIEFTDHIKECLPPWSSLPPFGSKQAQLIELASWDIQRS